MQEPHIAIGTTKCCLLDRFEIRDLSNAHAPFHECCTSGADVIGHQVQPLHRSRKPSHPSRPFPFQSQMSLQSSEAVRAKQVPTLSTFVGASQFRKMLVIESAKKLNVI